MDLSLVQGAEHGDECEGFRAMVHPLRLDLHPGDPTATGTTTATGTGGTASTGMGTTSIAGAADLLCDKKRDQQLASALQAEL